MSESDEQQEAIEEADRKDQIGYTRYLCERYLEDHPDHVPTLLRYAANLTSLAQYATAKAALDHAQTVVPEKWRHLVLLRRGWLTEALGDFPAASELYLQAHALNPDDATYLIYAGSAAFQQGDIDHAIDLATQATRCPEGCIDEAYFNLGGYLLSKCEYREAMACYRRALEIDPDYEIAKERLCDVELILRHPEE